jgi:hypothetical protein
VYISVNNNTNLNFLKILSNYTIWDRLSQKTISRYCPFKNISTVQQQPQRSTLSYYKLLFDFSPKLGQSVGLVKVNGLRISMVRECEWFMDKSGKYKGEWFMDKYGKRR